MARNFRELEAKMPPKSRTRAKMRAKDVMADIRRTLEFSQEQIAKLLDNEQPPTQANPKKISGD